MTVAANLQRLILAIAVALIVISTIDVFYMCQSNRCVSHASGVYMALATDLADDGEYYSPLLGEKGYRGTRYFPLYWSLHALLFRVIGDPFYAGFALGILAGLMMLAGLYYFLRGVGANHVVAFASVAALYGCKLTPILMTSIRGDILPVALTVCGLAVFAQPGALTNKRLVLMSLFFVLAFSSKLTSVFGVTAVCLVLLLNRNLKQCVILSAITILGFLLVIGGTQLASGGRFIEIVRSCAESGFTTEGVMRVPVKLRGVIASFRAIPDGATLMFLGLGLVGLIVQPRKQRTHISTIYLLVILAFMPLMFLNPGLHINHFLDPLVASVALLACMLVLKNIQSKAAALLTIVVLLILTLAAALLGWYKTAPWSYENRYSAATQILKEVEGPILSDNANVPILMGQQPFMLDAFMFRMIKDRDPSYGDELLNRVQTKQFSAIVLEKWATVGNHRGLHFGEDVYDSVERHYVLREDQNGWLFYFPRNE